MPADRRLTIETVRPGMKVRCVQPDGWEPLSTGEVFTILKVDGPWVRLTDTPGGWWVERFIPADPEPAPSWAADRMAALLVDWYVGTEAVTNRQTHVLTGHVRALFDAIEASGLLPRAPARTTDRAATLDDGWWA